MSKVSITALIRVLESLSYLGTADDNPAVCVVKSPHTSHPVVIPMNQSDSLPDSLVRHLLQDEPINITQVIQDAQAES